MTADELAVRLGPLVGPGARLSVGAMARGEEETCTVRYSDVRDWPALDKVLQEVTFWDGSEALTISPKSDK